MRKILLVLLVTLAGVAGVRVLADATQNRPDARESGTASEVVLDVRTRRLDPALAANALWATCHTTVSAVAVTAPLSPRDDVARSSESGRFAVTVSPALGEHDRRRLRGCLEDATIDRTWADVVSIAAVQLPAGGATAN